MCLAGQVKEAAGWIGWGYIGQCYGSLKMLLMFFFIYVYCIRWSPHLSSLEAFILSHQKPPSFLTGSPYLYSLEALFLPHQNPLSSLEALTYPHRKPSPLLAGSPLFTTPEVSLFPHWKP